MPLDLEDQKLRDIKGFYNKLNHNKLYGPRTIFNNSEYRLVNMAGHKLLAFLELKFLNRNNAIINICFDISTINQYNSNSVKLNNFIFNNINNFIFQIKNEPKLAHIKILYYSLHNNMSLLLSQILVNFGFVIVSNKSEISANKLSTDGIHSNYKLILRK